MKHCIFVVLLFLLTSSLFSQTKNINVASTIYNVLNVKIDVTTDENNKERILHPSDVVHIKLKLICDTLQDIKTSTLLFKNLNLLNTIKWTKLNKGIFETELILEISCPMQGSYAAVFLKDINNDERNINRYIYSLVKETETETTQALKYKSIPSNIDK